MKKRTLLVLAVALSITISHAQKDTNENLEIDVKKSKLKWSGEYAFYFGGHDGTISFKEGYFIKTDTVISGGEFIIDMTSIICNDIEDEEANEGLINHLKNDDFFDVVQFKTAKLVITSAEYHDNTHIKIYASLTIKGITLPVNFHAEINYEEQQMTAKFKIDRQRWGIDYNSKLRDGAIADGIGFEVTLSL